MTRSLIDSPTVQHRWRSKVSTGSLAPPCYPNTHRCHVGGRGSEVGSQTSRRPYIINRSFRPTTSVVGPFRRVCDVGVSSRHHSADLVSVSVRRFTFETLRSRFRSNSARRNRFIKNGGRERTGLKSSFPPVSGNGCLFGGEYFTVSGARW